MKPKKKAVQNEWALYSDDDGVVIYSSKSDALKAKRKWEREAANYVRGPFEVGSCRACNSHEKLLKLAKVIAVQDEFTCHKDADEHIRAAYAIINFWREKAISAISEAEK